MRLLWLLSLASAGALRVRPSGVIPRRCAIGLLGGTGGDVQHARGDVLKHGSRMVKALRHETIAL